MEAFRIISSIFLLCNWIAAASSCPRTCVCDNYGTKHLTDCDSQDMEAFPAGIPEWTTEISFDGNYLTTWDLTAFATTTYFEEMSVRYNLITDIKLSSPSNKSDGMRGSCNYANAIYPRVKKVNLRGNMLSVLPKCLLLSWPIIEILNLNENQLSRLADLNFALYKTPGGSLKELRLRGNQIASLTRDDWFAPENAIKTLELLDLGENLVSSVESGSFLFFPELLVVKLDQNRLSHIPGFAFITRGKRLKEIYLANNHITSIDEDAFAGLPALKVVDLSTNMIQCLMPPSFASCGVPTVEENSLENRWLNEFRPRFELDLGALNRLMVTGNSWLCDCHLKPMLHNVTIRRIMPQLRYERCDLPTRFRRSYLSAALSQISDCP